MDIQGILKSFSYSALASLVGMMASTIIILILPKVISIEQYSYWQLYMLYVSYVPLFHLGWPDGIYLKYGGSTYERLDLDYFTTQFVMFFIFEIIISIGFIIASTYVVDEPDKKYVVIVVLSTAFLSTVRIFFSSIYQATGRIKEYSIMILSEKVTCITLVGLLLFVGVRDYKTLILSDVLGKLGSFLYVIFISKNLLKGKINKSASIIWMCVKDNINIGMSLLIANMASILLIGIVRLFIEWRWDIVVFGKISLGLSVSNLLMLFINAAAVVLFPVIKRIETEKLVGVYKLLRRMLMIIMLGCMGLYGPIHIIMENWLPQYKESFYYMSILFPVCLYESRWALLINTYLKTLRKEKWILGINVFVLIISILLLYIFGIIFESLFATVFVIVLLVFLRSLVAELLLKKLIAISIWKNIFNEMILTVVFILSSCLLPIKSSSIFYVTIYIMWIIINRKDIINLTDKCKKILKNKPSALT